MLKTVCELSFFFSLLCQNVLACENHMSSCQSPPLFSNTDVTLFLTRFLTRRSCSDMSSQTLASTLHCLHETCILKRCSNCRVGWCSGHNVLLTAVSGGGLRVRFRHGTVHFIVKRVSTCPRRIRSGEVRSRRFGVTDMHSTSGLKTRMMKIQSFCSKKRQGSSYV